MPLTDQQKHALKAGALFHYRGSCFRLNSFLCEAEDKQCDDPLLAKLFSEIEAEEAAKLPAGMRRVKLRYCLPEEAEFVTGSGVCGCIARLNEMELAEHHERALAQGREQRRSTTITRPIDAKGNCDDGPQ